MNATITLLRGSNDELGEASELEPFRIQLAMTSSGHLGEEPAQMQPYIQQEAIGGVGARGPAARRRACLGLGILDRDTGHPQRVPAPLQTPSLLLLLQCWFRQILSTGCDAHGGSVPPQLKSEFASKSIPSSTAWPVVYRCSTLRSCSGILAHPISSQVSESMAHRTGFSCCGHPVPLRFACPYPSYPFPIAPTPREAGH